MSEDISALATTEELILHLIRLFKEPWTTNGDEGRQYREIYNELVKRDVIKGVLISSNGSCYPFDIIISNEWAERFKELQRFYEL